VLAFLNILRYAGDIHGLYDHEFRFIYVSGRKEATRKATWDWLAKHGFPPGPIHLRADGDYRKDSIVKAEIADRENLTMDTVFCVFDDRNQVVDMWRARGIRVFQVANGDF
jgi:phosphatidate phosphatase APP1